MRYGVLSTKLRTHAALACVAFGFLACTEYTSVTPSDGGADSQSPREDAGPSGSDSGLPGDASLTGSCDPNTAFGGATPLTTLVPPSPGPFAGYSLTGDELRVYYAQNGGIFTASRASMAADFTGFTAVPLPGAFGPARQPVVSRDGKTLMFTAIQGATENVVNATLPTPTAMGKVLGIAHDYVGALRSPAPIPSAPVLTFFAIGGTTDSMAVGTLMTVSDGQVSSLMSPEVFASAPVLSADGRRLYVAQTISVDGLKTKVVSTMSRKGDDISAWSLPTPMPALGTPGVAYPAWASTDDCRLYLTSGNTEGGTPHIVQRKPL